MSGIITPGIKLTLTKMVGENDTASSYGSGLLDVLSTPAMIAFMEHTAMMSVESCMDDGQGTVGTMVNIRHLKATPVGMKVTCTATLTEVDGRRLLFSVEAVDEKNRIGEGYHERFIIEKDKFMTKLKGG